MVEDYKVTEVWKDIPKYKGYYQASNLGNIRSVPRDYNSLSCHKYTKKFGYLQNI